MSEALCAIMGLIMGIALCLEATVRLEKRAAEMGFITISGQPYRLVPVDK